MNAVTAAILFHDTCSPLEAQRVLRISKSLVYRAIHSGEIPSFTIGGSIKVRTAFLRAKLGITEPAI
jgi:excisionase family DNA binding protein